MYLRALTLHSFRSYENLSLEFSEGHQLFLGGNGTGKTNLIEAISYLSSGKSCLRTLPEDALQWEKDFLKVRAEVSADDGTESSLEVVFQTMPRRQWAYFLRDVRVPLLKFIGALPTIVFLPQSLELFRGAPNDRRQFLDGLLVQLRPEYAGERLEYDRVLKQRNALLKQIAMGQADVSGLDVWDRELARTGSRIAEERGALLFALLKELRPRLKALGETWTEIELPHLCSGGDGSSAALERALLEARKRDLILQTTTVGPHRDDWRLLADGRGVASFASRGQQRACLIALLLAAARLFSVTRGERPVILLDDVLSELDDAHQEALFSQLQGHQFFLTSTHDLPLPKKDIERWTVHSGTVVSQKSLASRK